MGRRSVKMTYKLHDLNEQGLPSLVSNVQTFEDWQLKREDIAKRWKKIMGTLPEPVPLNITIHEETAENGYIRQHLTYDTAYHDKVTAYLLLPLKKGNSTFVDRSSHFPAIIAMHGTDARGKDSISRMDAKQNRKYALELVLRGYVVLIPDAITAGERIKENEKAYHNNYFYEDHPEWLSITAKNLTDHIQGIELLTQHELVDETRLGAIGHSFGGYNAYYLGGIDRRIKAVVSSCGFSTFTGDYRPHQWGYRDWYTHFPKITDMIKEGEIPFEFHEIMALVAPTPMFNWSGQSDHVFPHWKSIGSALHQVHHLYEKIGYPDHFTSLLGAEGHDFPPYIREATYRFLDKWLDHSPLVTGDDCLLDT